MSDLAIMGGSPVRRTPFKSWPPVDPETERRLLRVYRSGKWGAGDEVALFERRFASFIGVNHGVAVTNGTAALETALQTLGLEPGDEVIVPAYTFFSTVSAVLKNGAVPVFVDVDPETYGLDMKFLEQRLSDRTRAVIPVHLFGFPMDLEALPGSVTERGIKIVEDCAHAHGAARAGRKAGSWGDLSIFSFMSAKLMSAGEGGIILSREKDLAMRAASLRDCGRVPGRGPYEHVFLGTNQRITEFQAAILLEQLKHYPEALEDRRLFAGKLMQDLDHIAGIHAGQRTGADVNHAFLALPLEYDPGAFEGIPRNLFCMALQAEGIPCEPGYDRPVYKNPGLRSDSGATANLRVAPCPIAEGLAEKLILLPHHVLSGASKDRQDILDAMVKIKEQAAELLFSGTMTNQTGAVS